MAKRKTTSGTDKAFPNSELQSSSDGCSYLTLLARGLAAASEDTERAAIDLAAELHRRVLLSNLPPDVNQILPAGSLGRDTLDSILANMERMKKTRGMMIDGVALQEAAEAGMKEMLKVLSAGIHSKSGDDDVLKMQQTIDSLLLCLSLEVRFQTSPTTEIRLRLRGDESLE